MYRILRTGTILTFLVLIAASTAWAAPKPTADSPQALRAAIFGSSQVAPSCHERASAQAPRAEAGSADALSAITADATSYCTRAIDPLCIACYLGCPAGCSCHCNGWFAECCCDAE